MSDTRLAYGTAQTPAITSAQSLASDTTAGLLVACSAAVDQADGTPDVNALDFIVKAKITYPNSAPTVAYLTAYYAAFDGADWSDDGYGDAPDGTDQTITIGSPTNHRYAGTIAVVQNQIAIAMLASPATVFGAVPAKFCVVIHNGSGQTLSASGHAVRAVPVYAATA